MAGETLVCPKCKQKQVVPTVAANAAALAAVPAKQPAIDPWVYGIISFVWLLYALFNIFRCATSENATALHQIYYLASAGFAWLGMILSAILGRLYKR